MPKILIVEDDNFLLEMLAEECSKENFDVEISTDGKDVLEKIENGKFDLILLDLVLPKLHGLELLKKLKEENNTTPIIVLSNLSDKESVDTATSFGIRDYIVKAQSTPEEIVKKITEFLSDNYRKSDIDDKNQ